jgi:myo-inositol-1(or 4)-monophosphatase
MGRQALNDEVDWLSVCRAAADDVRAGLAAHPLRADRAHTTGRGAGGDTALVIDRLAEDAVVRRLEDLGQPLTLISEELGERALEGGGPPWVVVDPIDGSKNAKWGLPGHALSVAVADRQTMGGVRFAYVRELSGGPEWWAVEGGGLQAHGVAVDPPGEGSGLKMLGIESADPRLVAEYSGALVDTGAERLRAVGAIALSLAYVASGQLDAMVSLAPCRSFDAAAGQLLVREAGGAVAFPDTGPDPLSAPLDLEMRSRVAAAAGRGVLETVMRSF